MRATNEIYSLYHEYIFSIKRRHHIERLTVVVFMEQGLSSNEDSRVLFLFTFLCYLNFLNMISTSWFCFIPTGFIQTIKVLFYFSSLTTSYFEINECNV